MIIFGHRTRESQSGSGTFVCPNCRTTQYYEQLELRSWFTLYFIPIIPLMHQGTQVRCQGCMSRYDSEVLNAQHEINQALNDVVPAQLLDDSTGSFSSNPYAESNPYAANPYEGTSQSQQQFKNGQTSSLAIASVVLAVVSLPLILFCGLSLITSIAAIITGHLALSQIKKSSGGVGGRGIALGGVVGGYLLLTTTAIWIGFVLGPGIANSRADRRIAETRSTTTFTPRPRTSQPSTTSPSSVAPSTNLVAPTDFNPTPSYVPPSLPAHTPPTFPNRQNDVDVIMKRMKADSEASMRRAREFSENMAPPNLHPEFAPPAQPFPEMGPPASGLAPPTVPSIAPPDFPTNVTPGPRPSIARTTPKAVPIDVVQRFDDLRWTIHSLAFSPDDRWLVAGKLDRSIVLLDVASGRKLDENTKLDEFGQVVQVAFSRDGKTLIAAGYQGVVASFPISRDGRLGEIRQLTPHTREVESMTISPSADFVISGARGNVVWQSFLGSTNQSRRAKAFERKVMAIHLPKKGTQALATDGKTLASIDLRTANVSTLHTPKIGYASAAVFSPDGSFLAIGQSRQIDIVNTKTGVVEATFEASSGQRSLIFHPDGDKLLSGECGKVAYWDLTNQSLIANLEFKSSMYVKSMAVSGDGKYLAAASSNAQPNLKIVRLPESR